MLLKSLYLIKFELEINIISATFVQNTFKQIFTLFQTRKKIFIHLELFLKRIQNIFFYRKTFCLAFSSFSKIKKLLNFCSFGYKTIRVLNFEFTEGKKSIRK